ncbi:MAG: nucleoside monophosphate kinase [Candidatus Woesearchaeota archaeon]|nr:nucleoside monophosphate kinase [Candidatus Woesearchaeota archaeon]
MIITISGKPGSGKSTVGKLIAKKLKFRHYSIGDLRREIAKKHGLTIDELNKIGEKEVWTDKEVDDYLKRLGQTEDNFIVDGWISFYFIPDSIKIFLDVDLHEAAKRIFKDQRPDEDHKDSINEVFKMIKKRLEETTRRYEKHYGIKDFTDKKYYDLIINTTNLTINQVADKMLDFIQNKNQKPKYL